MKQKIYPLATERSVRIATLYWQNARIVIITKMELGNRVGKGLRLCITTDIII